MLAPMPLGGRVAVRPGSGLLAALRSPLSTAGAHLSKKNQRVQVSVVCLSPVTLSVDGVPSGMKRAESIPGVQSKFRQNINSKILLPSPIHGRRVGDEGLHHGRKPTFKHLASSTFSSNSAHVRLICITC